MARTSSKKNVVKPVNYLNKDFSDFRDNLIDFARQYFPNTYNDFNESSPGMMFIEMAAYVGDVLSFYIDKILNGTLDPAEERRLGLKWSPELSNRSFLAVNGTLLTAKLAMKEGIACHVAGGTHHSHFDFGSGNCVFNDLAYTSR